jgi:hypothetical protein
MAEQEVEVAWRAEFGRIHKTDPSHSIMRHRRATGQKVLNNR